MDQKYKVKKSERGETLGRFLHARLGDLSHKKIKQAIDENRVKVNGKNVFVASWNLKPGDEVAYTVGKKQAPEEPTRYHHVDVLYEDDDILAVNKPAFIDYDSFVANVNSYLRRIYQKRWAKSYYPYLGQMHRLDKETSGILLFTKKKSANILADQFRSRKIKKYYFAVVWGRVAQEHGIIRDKILKGDFEGGRKVKLDSSEDAKEAHTEYWVKERYDIATLLRLSLGTGRTHQIRIHLSERGHPLIGEKLYGGAVAAAQFGSPQLPIKRHALHASEVEFTHPITGKKIKLVAPLPKDFTDLVDNLRERI